MIMIMITKFDYSAHMQETEILSITWMKILKNVYPPFYIILPFHPTHQIVICASMYKHTYMY